MTFTGSEIRAALLAAVEAEWRSVVDVETAAGEERVTHYFHAIGWQWYLDRYGVDGRYSEEVRRRTGHLNWCGAGPAWCALNLVGHHLVDGQCVPVGLRPSIADHVLTSTYRANSPSHWATAGADPPAQIPLEDIRPGDMIAVVTGERKSYGDHFAVVAGPRNSFTIPTVEFNAAGELGDGRRGRGVVRRTRELDMVRRVYRLDERHFEYSKEEN